MHLCPYCSKEFEIKFSRGSHMKLCSANPNKRKHPRDGCVSNKKGKTKDTDPTILRASETYKRRMNSGEIKKPGGKIHTKEGLEKLSKLAKERNLGGVRQSKKILYSGVWLGSSYEHRVALELDAHGIRWELPKRMLYLDPNGKQRSYTPDFYLPEYDVYLDPKNDYLIENINPRLGFSDVEKIQLASKQNKVRIIILSEKELEWKIIIAKINATVG